MDVLNTKFVDLDYLCPSLYFHVIAPTPFCSPTNVQRLLNDCFRSSLCVCFQATDSADIILVSRPGKEPTSSSFWELFFWFLDIKTNTFARIACVSLPSLQAPFPLRQKWVKLHCLLKQLRHLCAIKLLTLSEISIQPTKNQKLFGFRHIDRQIYDISSSFCSIGAEKESQFFRIGLMTVKREFTQPTLLMEYILNILISLNLASGLRRSHQTILNEGIAMRSLWCSRPSVSKTGKVKLELEIRFSKSLRQFLYIFSAMKKVKYYVWVLKTLI